jgi:lipoprotein-releasing system permease protein
VTIINPLGHIADWQSLSQQLASIPHVQSAEPTVEIQALINDHRTLLPIAIKGISADQLKNQVPELVGKKYGIVLHESAAWRVGAQVGDKLLIITPTLQTTVMGTRPIMHNFTVAAVRPTEKFSHLQLARMSDLQTLLGMTNSATAIRLQLDELNHAGEVARILRQNPDFHYSVVTWAEHYADLFKALRLQKTMMFLILSLIVIIAAFNMLSSMVMLVADKRAAIAVLNTLGLSKRQIMAIFITQGLVIGCIGMISGTALGYLLSTHVTEIVHGLERLLSTKLIDQSVYMLDYLPSHIDWQDVAIINIITCILTLLATLYPSYKAAGIEPAKVLRGEG